MPIIKSAKKAARQAVKRTAHNGEIKRAIKAAVKTFKLHPTAENLSKAQSEYAKAAKKGLIKKNTASRRKANLAKIAKAAGTKPAAKKAMKAPAAKSVAKAPAKKAAPAKKPAAKKTATAKTAAKKPATKKTATAKK